jgi:excinuclease ABC subunit C
MVTDIPPLLAERLRNLPQHAGVYLFKDAGGNIIYIGKAKNLNNRVRSYFQSPDKQPRKVQLIVSEAVDVDYILAESEAHALRWEADLIRRERPRYNVRMRDDKRYPYIRISVQDPWPRVSIARSARNDGARYFGPFTDSTAVRSTLDTLNLLFPYIRCRKEITGKDRRPCLYFFIKRCVAPCVGAVSQEEYRTLIGEAINFLEGKQDSALEGLRQQMEEAAEALQFERAAGLRDRIRSASRVIDQQRVVIKKRIDQDVIGIARENDNVFAQVFYIREGKLRGRDYFPLVATADEGDDVIVRSFVLEHYGATEQIPPRILVPALPDDARAIEGWLREQAEHRVELTVPERGEGRRLVELAAANAREALERQKIEWQADERRTSGAIEDLQDYLELDTVPERIECYDISNIQGTSSVGSMVVFEGGKPKRSDYKRFKIKTVEGANDFASMAEVLTRRFKRLREGQSAQHDGSGNGAHGGSWDRVPDLVIVDGGKGQLGAALAVMEELELFAIPVVGLAKEREEIFLPGRPDPVVLPRGSESLFLVQRIRDEAHRFAITYHRVVRGKKSLHSALDDVPGVGPKRKRELLRAFGSVKGIKAATLDEIAAVPGMTRRSAQQLKEQL